MDRLAIAQIEKEANETGLDGNEWMDVVYARAASYGYAFTGAPCVCEDMGCNPDYGHLWHCGMEYAR